MSVLPLLMNDLHPRHAPDYVQGVMREYLDAELRAVSVRPRRSRLEQPIVLSVVRNENIRLPDFLRHYREAGVETFAIVDNGSTDGTLDYLAAQSDVDLYACDRPFHWTRKQGWISILIALYGRHRWYIHADGDEHVVFDGIDRGLTFADLCTGMEAKGLRRLRGVLVDMYPDGPVLRSAYMRGHRLQDAYPFFDGASYTQERYREIVSRKGGPRQRVFGQADAKFRPELTKYPIFRLEAGDVFANPHHVWPYAGNFDSECLLGILHYKFLPDVVSRIQNAIDAGNYWDGSLEYRCYRTVLGENPELALRYAGSLNYAGTHSLVSSSIIASLDAALWESLPNASSS